MPSSSGSSRQRERGHGQNMDLVGCDPIEKLVQESAHPVVESWIRDEDTERPVAQARLGAVSHNHSNAGRQVQPPE